MYLVSSCLAGINCRYNGKNTENNTVVTLLKQGEAIALCPEQLGGMPTPRASCELITDSGGNKKIVSEDGKDFTEEFREGANKALEIAKLLNIRKAILQSKSPSCGYGFIYDGTFSGKLIEGNGLTAELLSKNNIEVYTENDLDTLGI